ncbi:hypothetical protein UK23_22530 [Lentzea aerocolonigenes]|uniref:beta-N-acetylhexosaminidase n=1 Tax=Lentzea aerocolonigenes TaxID=68170 RepID=A0A0F0GU14_LENAE|nr:beta-N-acetylhexosaminidase [Lentzea aerocolonigenes]KJK46795.1 hypothetical protein UK23_22530 [Lentzea aerocolonigenes]
MIVPHPTRIVRRGKGFTFDCGTSVRVTPGAEQAARLLRALLRPATGLPLPITGHGQIVIALDAKLVGLGAEGYALTVNEHGVLLRAGTPAGLAHGVQTIRQLLPVEALKPTRVSDVDWTLPGVDIRDVPRLPWRGFMLDVARHFQPVHVVRRFIDLMALHKLNVLHLHLTDDQGWRMPIPSHPLLTSVGGWRTETNGDGVPHGGSYTRGELEGLIAYAAERGIRVMPEIEMPGHAGVALAAYPDLGIAPEPLPVWTRWGVSDAAFGLHALGFVREVLAEVLEIFPGEYVHLGGDECLLPEEVHGRFLTQAAEYVLDRGRIPATWEPIDDPRTLVMPWKDVTQAAKALERGQPVVMTPHTSTYLDYPQSGSEEPPGQPGYVVTMKDVYHVPLPDGVLGAQCQLWTEHVRTREHLEYMAFPRLAALADTLWSQRREWEGFTTRMRHHASRLAVLSIPAEVRREPCEHQ